MTEKYILESYPAFCGWRKMILKRHGLVLAGLLIIALGTLVTPVMAADHTLNPGDSIQENITNAIPGDTIILNPGIYNEHDIILDKNITIRANISAGNSEAYTIIDAENAGRIFSNNGSHALTVENLTLMNGYVTEWGGAIASGNGSITITVSYTHLTLPTNREV